MAVRPNFLFLMTDQQRADHLGCAGHPVLRTPHLDALAASGVHCRRAYVTNPLCMPSRSTLYTGLTPRGHGVRTNGIDLDPGIPTFTEALRRAGYRTHSVGKIHLRVYGLPIGTSEADVDPADFPEARDLWRSGRLTDLPAPYYGLETADFTGGHGGGIYGHYLQWLRAEHPGAERLLHLSAGEPARTGADQAWTMALPADLHYNTWCADRTIAFLESAAADARNGRPFLAWCSFPDPHHPYCPPRPWDRAYALDDVPPPTRRAGELDDLAPHFRQVFAEGVPTSGRVAATNIPDEQLREIIALTYGMVSFVDEQVGRVMGALERLGSTRRHRRRVPGGPRRDAGRSLATEQRPVSFRRHPARALDLELAGPLSGRCAERRAGEPARHGADDPRSGRGSRCRRARCRRCRKRRPCCRRGRGRS